MVDHGRICGPQNGRTFEANALSAHVRRCARREVRFTAVLVFGSALTRGCGSYARPPRTANQLWRGLEIAHGRIPGQYGAVQRRCDRDLGHDSEARADTAKRTRKGCDSAFAAQGSKGPLGKAACGVQPGESARISC